jgi:hypothetical protein
MEEMGPPSEADSATEFVYNWLCDLILIVARGPGTEFFDSFQSEARKIILEAEDTEDGAHDACEVAAAAIRDYLRSNRLGCEVLAVVIRDYLRRNCPGFTGEFPFALVDWSLVAAMYRATMGGD